MEPSLRIASETSVSTLLVDRTDPTADSTLRTDMSVRWLRADSAAESALRLLTLASSSASISSAPAAALLAANDAASA
jgi:hypothetical protein